MRLTNWSIKRSSRQAMVLLAAICATAASAAFLWAARGHPASTVYLELRSFAGNDGTKPASGLVMDSAGALYGATQLGGAADQGTVFSLTPPVKADDAWNEVVLHSFGAEGDGQYPVGDLVVDRNGALYGATAYGGAGHGTVFKLTPPESEGGAWTETTLYRFRGGSDGANPRAGLIIDERGALYGTTLWEGASGHGTVFKLTPSRTTGEGWIKSTLYSFRGGADGAGPRARLALDASGALYGTTELGGASDRGTVFKLTPSVRPDNAWTKSTLYDFLGGPDGAQPFSGVVKGPDGALYGTTYYGGGAPNCNGGCGTVFQLTPPTTTEGVWTETVLHKFQGGASDGGNPAGVIVGPNGTLIGAAEHRGANLSGVVFQLRAPAKGGGPWREAILYNLPGAGAVDQRAGRQVYDFAEPGTSNSNYGELVLGRDGALFGVIPQGGVRHLGVVYELQTIPQ